MSAPAPAPELYTVWRHRTAPRVVEVVGYFGKERIIIANCHTGRRTRISLRSFYASFTPADPHGAT